MSDARAIEAVTETLRNLVDIGVKEVEGNAHAVTRPPDRIDDTGFDLQVNLFLYQTAVDGALRNEAPQDLLPGETGEPSLPLVLHYLLTPVVKDGDDLQAHRLLGGALRILHENAVLTRADLALIAGGYSDVAGQVERIRITWQSLDEKDIYSLWSVFQAPYRISAAFEVRVVLIDNRRAGRTPLPALRRGEDDRGPVAQGDTTLPFPVLHAAVPPDRQPAARLGEIVTLQGARLTGTTAVRLTHPLLPDPVDVATPPADVTDDTVRFTVPNDPAALPAGLWSVSAVQPGPGPDDQVTNDVPFALAPRITSAMPMTVGRNPQGSADVSLTCEPSVRPRQRVFLLLGGRAVAAAQVAAPTGSLTFHVVAAEAGDHLTRLRVAGTDTLVVDRTVTPPEFDADQTVTVT